MAPRRRALPQSLQREISWVVNLAPVQSYIICPRRFSVKKSKLILQQLTTLLRQVWVWVKRAGGVIEELRASIVPEEMVIPKKHYTLRSFHDSRHVVYLVDTTEDECIRWQELTMKILKKTSKSEVQNEGVKKVMGETKRERVDNVLQTYPWSQKMQAYLPTGTSSMLFSIVFIPFQASSERMVCKGVEDTVARAMAWFSSAQASGVSIIFIGIQTELIFKESSKDMRDFCDAIGKGAIRHATSGGRFRMACTSNTMIDVVKAVRLWYVPPAAEVAVKLLLENGEPKFGLSLASTEEGFCYVVAVDDGSAGDRAGVRYLLDLAIKENKLLVISRVGEEKVVPWLVACDGSIHYYGVPTIRETLSLLRGQYKCACIHLMVWESTSEITNANQTISDLCEIKKNDSVTSIDLTQSSIPMPTTKRRTVSWRDSNGSQLTTISEF